MNRDVLEGQWTKMKGKVREKWGKLTDDDLEQIGGKKDQLVGRIQERYGEQRDKIEKDVDHFWKDFESPAAGRSMTR